MQSSVDLQFFVFEIILCCGMKKHLLILWHCFPGYKTDIKSVWYEEDLLNGP